MCACILSINVNLQLSDERSCSYLFGMTTTSFVVTAFRDPGEVYISYLMYGPPNDVAGIIPRRLDPDPPMAQVDDWWEAYPRELTVQNGR